MRKIEYSTHRTPGGEIVRTPISTEQMRKEQEKTEKLIQEIEADAPVFFSKEQFELLEKANAPVVKGFGYEPHFKRGRYRVKRLREVIENFKKQEQNQIEFFDEKFFIRCDFYEQIIKTLDSFIDETLADRPMIIDEEK